VIAFQKGVIAGEDAVIDELSRKAGNELSMLQRCNDEGEIIYVQISEKERRIGSGMSYLMLKRALRSKKVLSFVTVDTLVNEKVFITGVPVKETIIFVAELEDSKASRFLYIGDGIDDRRHGLLIRKKEIVSVVVDAVIERQFVRLIFPCGQDELENVVEKIRRVRAGAMMLIVSGMEMPEAIANKGGMAVQKMVVLVNEYQFLEDGFEDVAEIMPVLNSYEDFGVFKDSSTGELLYPEIISTLLFFGAVYVRYGEPPFNIILSGIGGTAKTGCLKVMSKVFSNDGSIISANMCTAKGLVPSYGDVPHPGLLIEPENFVKVVDEFFRRSEKEAMSKGLKDVIPFVHNFLTEAMNVVERRADVLAGSGKGQLPHGTFMRDSLLATDNLNPGVRNALATAVIQDRAVMRRFTFLQVRVEDAERVKMAKESPSDDEVVGLIDVQCRKKGYSLKQIGRFGRWFRREVTKVKTERGVCKLATEQLMRELIARALGMNEDHEVINRWVMELNLIPYYEAFVRCVTLSRKVFEQKEIGLPKGPYHPSMFDYLESERFFRRLFEDTFDVYRPGMSEAATQMEQGVKRSFGGFIDG
jgi:hypothetical protein